jgi:hypothetical protein
MRHTYWVEVALLNTESDDINVEYVECIGYNARQASEYAVGYISKLPFGSHITVISVERR